MDQTSAFLLPDICCAPPDECQQSVSRYHHHPRGLQLPAKCKPQMEQMEIPSPDTTALAEFHHFTIPMVPMSQTLLRKMEVIKLLSHLQLLSNLSPSAAWACVSPAESAMPHHSGTRCTTNAPDDAKYPVIGTTPIHGTARARSATWSASTATSWTTSTSPIAMHPSGP